MLLDLAFPLPLPQQRDTSTLVVAARWHAAARLRRSRRRVALSGRARAVSPLYLQALLNYEDRWFWRHPGINPCRLLRAGRQWLRERPRRLRRFDADHAGRAHPRAAIRARLAASPSRSLRALQLEAHLSKREILTLYLNRAPFGGTIEGVEAASWAYLGKPASQLSHAEAALLAVLPQSPSRLRPDREPERARVARDKVLGRMATLGVWSRERGRDARIEPVVARRCSRRCMRRCWRSACASAQPRAARIGARSTSTCSARWRNACRRTSRDLPERTSAALLVVDNRTLEARAYVGSVAFADKARLGHVDMVEAWRSPGSTLKPFLYGMALDDGLIHSESLMVDAPQAFGGYRPGNFDAAFNGPVGAAEALRLSLNVPAVDLLDRVGSARFAARLAHAGINLRFPHGARRTCR